MKKNIYKGKFVVFEGLDGSGQSTQVKLLSDFLIKNKNKVIFTKEPTMDSVAGKKIRQILDKKIRVKPAQLQRLFAQDRKEHLKNLIIPALKQGKFVISDRYFFSSFAYGAADGLNLNELIKLNEEFLIPDLTFILKVSPEICLNRIKQRGSKITLFEKKERLTEVWKFYQTFPEKFKKADIEIINGEKSIKEVFSTIKKILKSKLKPKLS